MKNLRFRRYNMSRLLRRYIFLLLTVFSPISAFSQTLIMNEVSNGPTGNQEYVEFVVVSNSVTYDCTSPTPPCIDIRGWIFDDNSGYHGTDGIATGAVRFSQDPIWSCVPLGTIILIYNGADRNPAIPPDDISMADNNCTIIAPINSTTLFESNTTTPGAVACSYPATGWTAGGNWNNTVLANPADCARIVNLAGCEVFSLCYGTDNLNNLIYFPGTGGQTCWYFNDVDPMNQANWSQGSASPSPGDQTPGLPNNAANAAYIGSFNNNCQPITPINVTASSTPSGCSCNGTVTATATGSIGGYTYVWYDAAFNPIGQNTATATGLCPGTYVVIATSHIGCPDTTYTTVASSGSVTQSINAATICNGASATLTATPSINGGTFSWSPGGATTQSITVSPSSTTVYSCTYTYTGCTTTATSTVTVNPVPTLTVNSPTICSGSSATLTANPSIAGGTYTWSGGGGNSATATVSPAATTTYTVDYLLAGCPASAISTVTVNPLPVVSLNASTICSGASATLTATVAPAGGTYSWSPGGQTTGTISVSPAATTTYSVTYTNAGCTSTASNSVTVNPLPTVSVNASTICAGSAATLTATVSPAGGTYAWSPGGQTTGSISVSPSSTTTYSVTYTNAGCTSTATNSVTVNPLPTLSINSSTICAGSSATLTATPSIAGGTYSWSPGGQTTAGITVTPATTTTYTATYTASGCSATSSSTVTVNPLPTVSVNSTSVCSGSSATLTATPSIIGGTYSWSPGGQTANSISVSPVASTNYTVTYDLSGCTATATSAVTVIPLPTVNVNSATICNGSSTTLTGTPSIAGGTFTWSPGGQTTAAISVSPTGTTTYSVTYDLAGCTATSSGTVTVNPLPNVVATSATICNGQNATLNVTGAASYLWSNGNTTSSITISPTTTTTYSVTGTTNGCSATAIGTVTVTPLPVVSVNSVTICNGQSTTLNASGATSYSWNTGAASASITVNPATTTTYTVTGTGSGCSSTASSTVTVNPLPIVSATSATICQGQSATINATGAATYSWNNGNLTASINVSPASTTVYTVTGTTNGCSSTASGTVSVTPLPVISVNSPSICNGLTTTLTATGATTYLWNTGATANSISVTPSSTTTYTVTGIASGCSASSVST
ncbi:MAG: hypothetical protein U0X76_05040 [Bacteroidia bacterium]